VPSGFLPENAVILFAVVGAGAVEAVFSFFFEDVFGCVQPDINTRDIKDIVDN
jgi:hypothetical protein